MPKTRTFLFLIENITALSSSQHQTTPDQMHTTELLLFIPPQPSAGCPLLGGCAVNVCSRSCLQSETNLVSYDDDSFSACCVHCVNMYMFACCIV